MKMNAYFEMHVDIENFGYDCQFSVENQIDEDLDEYQSRVHREVDEVFKGIKENEKERKHL